VIIGNTEPKPESGRVGIAATSKYAATVSTFLSHVAPQLSEQDDPAFWTAVAHVVAEQVEAGTDLSMRCFLEVGVCSHWVRPHQTRWGAAGGFAWPAGYGGGTGYNIAGLPEFDWSILFRADADSLVRVDKYSGKRRRVLRIAAPARTARHEQAVVHSILYPEKKVEFFGFRKRENEWLLLADSRV
jgi:hypothetical protein